ncbi:MAG: alpha/beta hydrolase [Candidatus Omnitrophota bacterium]
MEKLAKKDKQVRALLKLVKKHQRLTFTQKFQKEIIDKFVIDVVNDFLEKIGLAQSSISKTTPKEMKTDIHKFLDIESDNVISQDGTRIHYIYGGNKKSALTLFFLHGISQNSTIWRTTLSWFEDWAKIVTMDARGHGKSGPSQDDNDDPDINNSIRDLKAVAKKLHLKNIVAFGFSKGGIELSNLPQLTIKITVQNFVKGAVFISTTFLNPFRSFLKVRNKKNAENVYEHVINILDLLGSEKKGSIRKIINTAVIFSYRYTFLRQVINTFVAMALINPDFKIAIIDYMENFNQTTLREITLRLKALKKVDNRKRLSKIEIPVRWIIGKDDLLVLEQEQTSQAKLIKDVYIEYVEKAKHSPLITNKKARISGIYDFLLAYIYPNLCLDYLTEILTQEDIDEAKVLADLEILTMFENMDFSQQQFGLKPILKNQNSLAAIIKKFLNAKGEDSQNLKAMIQQRQSEKILLDQLRKTFNMFYQNRNNLKNINKNYLLSELEKNTKIVSELTIDSWNERKWQDILLIIKKYFNQAKLSTIFAVLNAKGKYKGISEQESLSLFAQGWLSILKANQTTKDLYVDESFLLKFNKISPKGLILPAIINTSI